MKAVLSASSLFLVALLISQYASGQTSPADRPSAEATARSDLEQVQEAAE